ncbi:type II toxin-antitoxin system RelE/ParE family toxin [Thiohalocapsa sp.]|uniref:type II toxin-antitoxin system RelE family toxin n=1 Tax=Thiohalocapsa sp. TaxID=2497641 RepID=UPI00345C4F17
MARWELVIERRAQKALARIEKRDRDRIAKAIRALAQEPRSPGAKKLAGRDVYRVRVGDYRVLYEIDGDPASGSRVGALAEYVAAQDGLSLTLSRPLYLAIMGFGWIRNRRPFGGCTKLIWPGRSCSSSWCLSAWQRWPSRFSAGICPAPACGARQCGNRAGLGSHMSRAQIYQLVNDVQWETLVTCA